jgi:outer membrane protein OmpA-like peptidoglycan-associated protein
MNPEGTAGFFSSDRDGTDDIYQFKTIRVEIYVFDEEDRTPIPSSSIALYEAGNLEPIDARLTNSEGMLLFQRFEFNKTYDAVASARKYRPNKTRFNTEIPTLPFDGVIRDTIYLKRRPSVDIIILANQKSENQVFLSFNKDVIELNDTELLRKDELYELFDNAGINTLVNTRNPGEKVIVFDQFPIFRLNDLTDVQNQNRLTEILEKKYIIVKSITLIQNIRYNFATSDFGNDVVPEEQFTKVANVLRKFDHLLLKLSSHTDRCPLDGNYDNQALSQRRNAAAHRFILQTLSNAPFDVNRIKTCAYTFEYPVDDNYGPDGCKNDFNRRTEFKFIYRGRDKYREDVMCHPDAIQFIKEEDRSTVKRRQP